MSEPTHIRLRWLTALGATEPLTVPVRSVSERAAFAMMATSQGPGTRGLYELVDRQGNVLRDGPCRIIFQRKGAGIGIELLARPPMRRSSSPAPPSDEALAQATKAAKATQPERPQKRQLPKVPPRVAPLGAKPRVPNRPIPKPKPLAPKPSLSAEEKSESKATPRAGQGSQSDRPILRPPSDAPPRSSQGSSPETDAPESILGSRPPRTRVATQSGIGVAGADNKTDNKAPRLKTEVGIGQMDPSRDIPAAHAATDSPAPVPDSSPPSGADVEIEDIERDSAERDSAEREPTDLPGLDEAAESDTSEDLPRAPHGSVPDLDISLPTDLISGLPEIDEEKWADSDDFNLPELPKWEPPPPSPPPPRYDAGSWEPPLYEPELESKQADESTSTQDPLDEELPGDEVMLDEDDEDDESETETFPPKAGKARRASISAPPAEGAHPSAAPPEHAESPSLARNSVRRARVATRVKGTGAEGLAIGIDLGTSNTCASAVIDGVPQVIPTRFGTNTIPSVLTVIDSRVVVGHAAAKRMILNPHETVYGSKRLVGRAYTDELADEYQPSFAFPLVETEDHRFGASLKGRVVSFEQVAEYLLAEVRDVAEQHLGQRVHRATITVPAYFGDAQREAVRRAARGAMLSIDRIVPEPTAAAVAYGYDAAEEHTLVVFDLGGGTFDVSVLKVGDNRFEVLATGGDAFLGGIDIDDLIAEFLIEEFQKVERMTLEPTPQQLARLREAAEEAKCGLSMQNKVAINLPHFARIGDTPRELRATLSQAKLDELSTGFVDRLIAITAATLADCKLAPHDVDDVLLVGGMTRMALIPQRVEEYFGRRPSRRINPDEAVALGAARLAESGGKVTLLDVLPLSIGAAGSGRHFQRLIPRNTQVPVQKGFTVRTSVEDQTAYRMPLFQGEREDAAENEYLGTLMIEELPPGPAGSEIDVLFDLDEQCFLEVRAAHLATGRGLAVYINREEGAEKAIAALESYAGPAQEKTKKKSGLGRFFTRLRSFFS